MTTAIRIPQVASTDNGHGRKIKIESEPVKANPAAQALIDGLNHDLAGEYQAILMYTHYSAKLTGPYRRELRALFRWRSPTNKATPSSWRTRVAALGGEPTTIPGRCRQPTNHERCWNMPWQRRSKRSSITANAFRQAEEHGDIGGRFV